MRKLVLFPLTSSLVFFGGSAVASMDEYCNVATLRGTYISSASGTQAGTPIATIVMAFHDGNGHIIVKRKNADNSEALVKGTYHLGRNCRADIKNSDGRTLTYFVAPSGDGYAFVVTSGVTEAGDAKRVSQSNLLKP